MRSDPDKRSVALCESQPITAEGVRALLAASGDLECRWAIPNLTVALQVLRQQPANVLLLDKSLGLTQVLHALEDLREAAPSAAAVVWGTSMTEAEALRCLQGGARGLLRKTADLGSLLACLRAVAAGQTWLEECVFRDGPRLEQPVRSDLTERERQVLTLVEQGLKNKEIAADLGIRPGTVKIHLKHIFEKTGVHGRYGLALNGMRQRGVLGLQDRQTLPRSA
jgi:DNA-binding NarL/FixJ family response regulator